MSKRFFYFCGVMPFYAETSKVWIICGRIWVARSILRRRWVIEINGSFYE